MKCRRTGPARSRRKKSGQIASPAMKPPTCAHHATPAAAWPPTEKLPLSSWLMNQKPRKKKAGSSKKNGMMKIGINVRMRAPGIYAPYQPRFEWNLWFASLASWESEPWVLATEARLLAAEPAVLRLFAADPFHGTRPQAVRAVLWQYWFTDRATRARTGAWWRRHYLGLYAPQLDESTAPPPGDLMPGAPGP